MAFAEGIPPDASRAAHIALGVTALPALADITVSDYGDTPDRAIYNAEQQCHENLHAKYTVKKLYLEGYHGGVPWYYAELDCY